MSDRDSPLWLRIKAYRTQPTLRALTPAYFSSPVSPTLSPKHVTVSQQPEHPELVHTSPRWLTAPSVYKALFPGVRSARVLS